MGQRWPGVDPSTFLGLVDQRSRMTLHALPRLLDTKKLHAECLEAAAPWERPEAVTTAISQFLEDQRQLALEALPAIAEVNLGDDAAAWAAWVEKHRATLGPQVEPEGWSG